MVAAPDLFSSLALCGCCFHCRDRQLLRLSTRRHAAAYGLPSDSVRTTLPCCILMLNASCQRCTRHCRVTAPPFRMRVCTFYDVFVDCNNISISAVLTKLPAPVPIDSLPLILSIHAPNLLEIGVAPITIAKDADCYRHTHTVRCVCRNSCTDVCLPGCFEALGRRRL